MTDVIVAIVLMLVAVCAAELVRMTCRRQLLTPVQPQQAGSVATSGAQLEMSH